MSFILMITILIINLIILIITMLVGLKIKDFVSPKSADQEIKKFIESFERNIKDEFVINRSETNQNSKNTREELTTLFGLLELNFKNEIKEFNEFQKEKFENFSISLNNLIKSNDEKMDIINTKIENKFIDISKNLNDNSKESRLELNETLQAFGVSSNTNFKEFRELQQVRFEQFDKELKNLIKSNEEKMEKINSQIDNKFIDITKKLNENSKDSREELSKSQLSFSNNLSAGLKDFTSQLRIKFEDLNKQQLEVNKIFTESINQISYSIEKQLKFIRDDNSQQLNEIRNTVDEKLQTTLEKRLGESFKQVSDRLEEVHKGLGEMKNLAVGVGDLKKVLSNVKTRGILGEYALGNILEQMLTPQQYAMNVATKEGSQANVEYAIKLPGKDSDNIVWLPIDAKFPKESYEKLLEAYDVGDKSNIVLAQKELFKTVEIFAKSISEKYIDPPNTTDFAIMFVPFESLYAEILRHPALFEKIQRLYHITVTGPTTLSALLNSLQMGFKTLSIQKRSSEVWKVLSAVKTEFNKFSKQLSKVHKQLATASNSLDDLRNTRTNVMIRKLKNIDDIDSISAQKILEIPSLETNKDY